MVLIFLVMLIPPLIAVLVLSLISRRLRPTVHTSLIALSSVLLLTPSLGPATIAVVPTPFGYLLLATVMGDGWGELMNWLMQYPLWHALAFPATALIAYLTIHWLRPNNSFKPNPLRGSA